MIERVRREIETWGKLSKKMKLGILVKKDAMRLEEKKKARQHMRKNQHIQMREFLREQKERKGTRKNDASLTWDVFWLGGEDALKYTHHVS